MKTLYTSNSLPTLAIGLLLLLLLTTASPSLNAGSNNNAFIITTVDNIKGQYTMESFQSVCISGSYGEYEFVLIQGKREMYKKSCICEKYDQYQEAAGDPLIYKLQFWQVVKDCQVPFNINQISSAEHGGVKDHPDGMNLQEEEVFTTKYIVNQAGNLELSADFSIYPNPAKEFFVMDYQLNDGDRIDFHMYDALGKEIIFYNNELLQETGMHTTTYNISDLMGGVYFYVVSINDEKKSGRLIISD